VDVNEGHQASSRRVRTRSREVGKSEVIDYLWKSVARGLFPEEESSSFETHPVPIRPFPPCFPALALEPAFPQGAPITAAFQCISRFLLDNIIHRICEANKRCWILMGIASDLGQSVAFCT
jgi:hypothetical protein